MLANIDELFDREELSAAPDPGWPDCFNSGVFVFRPSLETYARLLEYCSEHGSFDGKPPRCCADVKAPAGPRRTLVVDEIMAFSAKAVVILSGVWALTRGLDVTALLGGGGGGSKVKFEARTFNSSR